MGGMGSPNVQQAQRSLNVELIWRSSPVHLISKCRRCFGAFTRRGPSQVVQSSVPTNTQHAQKDRQRPLSDLSVPELRIYHASQPSSHPKPFCMRPPSLLK